MAGKVVFGTWLKRQRLRAGYSQAGMAFAMHEASGRTEAAEVSRIGKLENGAIKQPTGVDVRLFALVLGVSQRDVLRAAGLLTEAEDVVVPRFPAGSWRSELDGFLDVATEDEAAILCRMVFAVTHGRGLSEDAVRRIMEERGDVAGGVPAERDDDTAPT